MKTQIKSVFFFLIAVLLFSAGGKAQEWRWANYWNGGDGPGTANYYNKIVGTAMDDDGNVYVYGQFGQSTQLYDVNTDHNFVDNSYVMSGDQPGCVLVKFDSLGNYLWSKVIKSSHQNDIPSWMELRDDRITISGNMSYYNVNMNSWIYYLDTFATFRQIPYTFFVTLDLDGNLIEDHFLYSRSRGFIHGQRYNLYIDNINGVKFHRDTEGNTYVFAGTGYFGLEENPHTVVVDDTVSYDIYLPGSTGDLTDTNTNGLNNVVIYKFSPEWELLWAKCMIDHAEGIATDYEYWGYGDSVHPFYTPYVYCVSFDEDDNMYVSGNIQLALFGNYGGDIHDFPVHIYWDSTHYGTIRDASSTEYMPFILKYNTDGNLVWCNQMYSVAGSAYPYFKHHWEKNHVYDKYLFIVGSGANDSNTDAWIAFDSLGREQLSRSQDSQDGRAFFACYNKMTGQYITHGIVPAIKGSIVTIGKTGITSKNNQVLAESICIYPNNSQKDILLNHWAIDGTYLGSDTIEDEGSVGCRLGNVILDDRGYLLMDFMIKSHVRFNDQISLNCSYVTSNAVFALRYDPRYTVPYPVADDLNIASNNRPANVLTLYPNPTCDKLNLQLSTDERITRTEIYDLSGKLIVRQRSGEPVNVSALASGIYIVKIYAGKQTYSAQFEKM